MYSPQPNIGTLARAAPVEYEAEVTSGRRDLVLLGLSLLAITPFFAADLVLSTDLPQHLAHAALAQRGTQPPFVVDLQPRPYLLATHLLLALAPIGGLELAGRLALLIYALGLVVAFRAVIDSSPARDPRLAWLAPLFIQSWPVAYGFLPYVLGLPPILGALAAARRLREGPSVVRIVALVGSVLLAVYAHPLTGLLAFLLAQTQLYDLPKARRSPPLFFSAVAAAAFGASAMIARPPPSAVFETDLGLVTWWRYSAKTKVIDFALAYLPGHWDLVLALPAVVALLLALVLGRRGERDPLERAALVIGLLYLAAPADLALGGLQISLLGPRLVVPWWLLLVAAIRGPLPRFVPWAGAFSTVGLSLLLCQQARHYSDRWSPPLRAALAEIPKGAVLSARLQKPARPVLHPGLVGPPEGHLLQLAYLSGARAVEGTFSTRQAPVWRTGRLAPDLVWVQTATGSIELRGIEDDRRMKTSGAPAE